MRPSAWLLAAVLVVAKAQEEAAPLPLPLMTEALKEELPIYQREESSFWQLWEYALNNDAPSSPVGPPAVPRGGNVEAKTVLAPSLSAEMHLIPQDAGDVRFGDGTLLKNLRHDYLLDHLLLQPLPPTDPRLDDPNGASLTTASGKEVMMTKDQDGVVSANGVAAERYVTLADGTVIYFLSDILFDNRAKVTRAFEATHTPDLATDPLGPPLDLPHRPIIRAPAPPPPGTPGIAAPPAIPPEDAIVRAPAPPRQEPSPPAPLAPEVMAPAPPTTPQLSEP